MSNKRFGIVLVIVFITTLFVSSDIDRGIIVPTDPTSLEESPVPVSGDIHITVIPVYFPDCQPILPIANISSLIFGNISDYFYSESYGNAWFTGSVLDWVSVEQNRSFYDRGSLNSRIPEIRNNASLGCQIFRDEVKEKFIMTEMNFTEHILILYAGGSTIHPHHFDLTVDVGSAQRECETAIAPELYSLGTIAHEIAHGLGLHDLYNMDKQNCLGEFVGDFDLMDNSGHSGINGMCSYSKISLGWIKPNEILDIDNNATVRLLRIEEWGDGPRVVRIPIDRWRYYIVEAQYYWPTPGILISRVDRSRDTGGYGRVEVVRTAQGIRSVKRSLFTEHQRFIDSDLGLMVEVIDNDDPWHEIEIIFTNVDSPQTISIPVNIGEIHNVSSVVDLNGTSYFAVCALNRTTSLRHIHLYRLTDTLEYLTHSPLVNDSINPVLVSGYDGILLFYEVVNSDRHTVVAQYGENITIVSEDDDARHPTAAFSGNGLYVAYENHTDDSSNLIIRKGSQHGWSYGISLLVESSSTVEPSESGVPHSPQLIPANNYAVLTYLWSSDHQSELRCKWDILSPNITLSFGNVEHFILAPLSEYRVFLTITLSNGTTAVYYWNSWENQPELISSHEGNGKALIPILGFWEGYEVDEGFVFDRVWDTWYRSGARLTLQLGTSRLLSAGFCSLYGSTALSAVSVEEEAATITLWPILSLSSGGERPIGDLAIAIGGKCLIASILCLVVYYRGDDRLLNKFR